MRRMLRDKRGFTLTEVLIMIIIAVLVVAAMISTWTFAQKVWTGERSNTLLRIDLLKALETIRNEVRLSSATYMTFYPEGEVTYTAMSLPSADVDTNGFLTITDGKIAWDKTIIYHIVEEDGKKHLRRSVIDSWDSTLTEDERYAQLESVLSGDITADLYSDLIRENLDYLEISQLAGLVDFYDESSDPVKVSNVVFGYTTLDAGSHDIRFTAEDLNPDSTGYAFGIDNIRIMPSGSYREAEYYNSSFAPAGSIDSSGAGITRVYDNEWRNSNFLEYDAAGAGDYLEFTDSYDLVRDSAFSGASPDNVFIYGEEMRMKLELPSDRVGGDEDIVWSAASETEDTEIDGDDGNLPAYPITIRTVLHHDKIDNSGTTTADPVRGYLLRCKFTAPEDNPFKIEAAYITRRDKSADEYVGLANQSTSGLPVEDYHRHQRLYFQDAYDMDGDGDSTDTVTYAYIPSGGQVWSEWVCFPLALEDSAGDEADYLITFYVPQLDDPFLIWPSGWSFNPGDDDVRYWEGGATMDHSYYLTTGDLPSASGTPVWSLYDGTTNMIYAVTEVDVAQKSGSVESQIYDTALASPSYNQIKWSEDSPSGTEVRMKARSSSDRFMTGATDWDSITGSTTNPSSLGIGSGRYFQFKGELATTLYWRVDSSTLSYENYINSQVTMMNVYEFPASAGEPYIAGYTSLWIDDVEVNWPGDETVCQITGDIAKKDDYGQVRVTIDGEDLIKALTIGIGVSMDFHGRLLHKENTIEVEPRNTGK